MWSHHAWGFFPCGLLVFLLILFLVLRFCVFRNAYRCGRGAWHQDPEAILKRRLATGDIDEAEYTKLRDLMK